MRRVVVTGMGIVSSIGDTAQEVLESLQAGRSGIVRAQEYADLGFRCQVHGAPKLNPFEALDRRTTRFMGQGAAWNYIAMQQAIADAGLEDGDVSNERTGIIMGSGGPSTPPSWKRRTSPAQKARSASGRRPCRKPCPRPTRRRWPPRSRSAA